MSTGKVSFTFDDGRLSTYVNAFPLLRERGVRGHLAVVTDRVGGEDQYSWDELKVMADHGWEVMSHSRTHWLPDLDEAQMYAEVVESRRILEAKGYAARIFNFPGGSWDDDDRFATGSPFDLLVRSTYDAYIPENAPHPIAVPVDRYALGYLCCECYGDPQFEAPLDEILATVDRCAAEGLWAQLIWHDVKGGYVETLETVARRVEQLVQAGTLVNVTISEALGLGT